MRKSNQYHRVTAATRVVKDSVGSLGRGDHSKNLRQSSISYPQLEGPMLCQHTHLGRRMGSTETTLLSSEEKLSSSDKTTCPDSYVTDPLMVTFHKWSWNSARFEQCRSLHRVAVGNYKYRLQ